MSRLATRRAVLLLLVVVAVAAAYGLLLRSWLLGHLTLDSDEAVAGLMARGALAGHFATFYWGQHYGGVEPYLVAVVLWATGGSPLGIEATPALLSAVGAVLVGVVVTGATASRRLGALAGAAAWIWPYAVVWNSLREYGFRGVVLVCGLVALAAALSIFRGRAVVASSLVLGLAAGLGWWASPEVAYFAVPVAILLLASRERLSLRPALAALAGALVGALPWLYTNVRTGFASLSASALPTYEGIGYWGRLSVFFRDMLPLQLGVRTVQGGAWVGGPVVGPVLYGAAGAVAVAALVRAAAAVRQGRAAAPLVAVAGGVVAFPWLYALVPATGFWNDGRYGVLLPCLLVLLLALALAGPGRLVDVSAGMFSPSGGAVESGGAVAGVADERRPPAWLRARHARRRRPPPARRAWSRPAVRPAAVAVACAGLVAMGALTVGAAQAGGVPPGPGALFHGWGDPEGPVRQVAADMVRHGIRDAYGDYWTAYVLDMVDPGGVTVTPSHLDVVRWPAAAARVRAARHPAWLFYAPDHLAAASVAFDDPEPGPGNYTLAQFESVLGGLRVPYRVVRLGVLTAVVPARRVTLPTP